MTASDDWLQQFVPDAEKTVEDETTRQQRTDRLRDQKEYWREVNIRALVAGRARITEAIMHTIATLDAAGNPGLATVYEFSVFRPPWQGWCLDDSKHFFLLANGDIASRPPIDAPRKRQRSSPQDYAESVTLTAYKEFAHSDDRWGVERDELLTPPAAFQKWLDAKVADTAKILVTLLVRYGLRP